MSIIKPRITEKGSLVNAQNVYTFEIDRHATKKDVKKAVAEIYKVKPVRINITRNPAKSVMHQGKMGRTRGLKKAYVYLKEGDKIDL